MTFVRFRVNHVLKSSLDRESSILDLTKGQLVGARSCTITIYYGLALEKWEILKNVM